MPETVQSRVQSVGGLSFDLEIHVSMYRVADETPVDVP